MHKIFPLSNLKVDKYFAKLNSTTYLTSYFKFWRFINLIVFLNIFYYSGENDLSTKKNINKKISEAKSKLDINQNCSNK